MKVNASNNFLCDVLTVILFQFLGNLCNPDFCVQETNDKLNQNVNPTENYHCHYCSKIFKSKLKLVPHFRKHKFPKKYSCKQCSAQFFEHTALRHHLLICSKTNRNNLNCIDVPAPQQQAQVVTDVQNVEKEYKCLECGKFFSHYKYLYEHKKIHEGIIYRCVLCPSTYKSKSGFTYHLRTEHVLREFECHHCQTTFKTKKSLKNHMFLHFKSIGYTCNQCSVLFKNRTRLVYHQNTVYFLFYFYLKTIFGNHLEFWQLRINKESEDF
jgi:KRAB domain-containing zinc finger protein